MTAKSRASYSHLFMAVAVVATGLAISCGGGDGRNPGAAPVAIATVASGNNAASVAQSRTAQPAGATPFVVNVSISDLEISPSTASVPAGRPVLLVVRNRGLKVHGYHIDGLQPKDMIWFELLPEGLESAAAGDHVGSGHATEAAQPDPQTLAVLDEHAAHHDNWAMVPHRVCDIQSAGCGHGGHVQVQMSPGETAFVMFIPVYAGSHSVLDLTRPDLSATLVVF